MPNHRAAPRRRPVVTLVALLAALLVSVSLASSQGGAATTAAPSRMFVATLATHANTAAAESKAGLKVGMLEVQWRRFVPTRGKVDVGYATGIRAQYQKLRKAGMQVTLGLGLHFTPSWVLAAKSNHMVDNHGRYSGQADFVFNRGVRLAAMWYLRRLDTWIGLQDAWAVRITSGGSSELLYPSGSYWAYSPGAQSGKGRPLSLPANPRPGFRPGDHSTAAQRRTWAHWYVGALANVADWQMATVRNLGFRGYFELITPGQGVRPNQWNTQVARGLAEGGLGRGAAWYALYGSLRSRTNVVAYLSSLADGTMDGDGCAASDAKRPLKGTNFLLWSGARWLAWVAHHYGMRIAGEPPGYPATAAARRHYTDLSAKGLLATAMRQARSCGFQGVYWAHDDQVQNRTIPLSALAKYTSADAVAPARP